MESSTQVLRRMLDERGVEWSTTKGCDSDSITTVHVDGRFGGTEWEAFELADGTFQVTAGIYDELTSEQFITVTLGDNGAARSNNGVTADEGGETRYHKLFGTPERAARTMHGDTPLCDICEMRGKPCDGCPLVEDYDALLEWLRGDAE